MKPRRKTVLKSTLILVLGTLFSRVLGMFRDAATAAMLGMSAGGIMDSFVLAFRLPDVTRRMFGEGSLSISFIPVFAKLWNDDRKNAWKLVSVALTGILVFVSGFVVVGEFLCLIATTCFPPESKVHVAAQLTSLMLPYLILICMAAIAAATLQTLGHFFVPSLIPAILNLVWLFGILVVAPYWTDDPRSRCYLLTGCIVLAGFLQFSIQIPVLRKLGFRFHFDWRPIQKEICTISSTFFPSMFGLMSTQINILVASMIAWAFSGRLDESIWWLGRMVTYPMQTGSTSAIYFSERLYEFPQGLLGLAIATAIYPMLSRHAAKKDYHAISDDLGFGLRAIFALAIPSGVGLMLLSNDLAHMLYQRGAFTPDDMYRTGDMIFGFSFGVCGFCAIPLLIRAFYSVGDIQNPVRTGVIGILANFALGMGLIWTFAELGLAYAASFSATLQTILLLVIFSVKYGWFDYRALVFSIGRSCMATLLMGAVVKVVIDSVPGASSFSDLVRITLATGIGFVVFSVSYFILGGHEIERLVSKEKKNDFLLRKNRKRSKKKKK